MPTKQRPFQPTLVRCQVWRVYQKGLETWILGLLQPVFDTYIGEDVGPGILKRIKIMELQLNHEAPVFSDMQRRNSRKDSDLNCIFSVRLLPRSTFSAQS